MVYVDKSSVCSFINSLSQGRPGKVQIERIWDMGHLQEVKSAWTKCMRLWEWTCFDHYTLEQRIDGYGCL